MQNMVELIGYYGSDEIIACSAWTSTSRDLTEDKKARIPKLIDMLWKNGHETPFEKGQVHFLVDTDIATHIHLLKHRISSMNAESARYKELNDDKFYIPDDFAQVDAITETWKWEDEKIRSWAEVLRAHSNLSNKLYHECLTQIEPKLGRKRAKESARFFKTYNTQIQGDVMFNLRSFANFERLRNAGGAQKEVRELAAEMLRLIEEIPGKPFEHTIQAWRNKGVV